jgi:hypothetical protein
VSNAFTPFTHAVLAQLAAEPGTGAHTAARWAARRLAQEVYLEDCRAAKERRDKWLAILDADVTPNPLAPGKEP